MALTDGLISVWHMNNDWLDSWGTNNGTASGATFSASAKLGSHAGNFDGVDDKVEIANESNFDFERTQPFSIQIWYKKDNAADTQWLLTKFLNPGASRGYGILHNNDERIYFFLVNTYSSNTLQCRTTDPFSSTTNWYHLVITYSGSSLASGVKFYVDNVLQTNYVNVDTLSATTLNDTPIYIAGNESPYFFDGLQDEVAIWNRVLTSGEVAELWNGGAGIELGAGGQPLNLRGAFIPGMRQWQPNMLRR